MKNIKSIIILFTIASLLLVSCSVNKPMVNQTYIKDNLNFNIKDEINKSVLEGFFNNDSSKIPKDCDLFLK